MIPKLHIVTDDEILARPDFEKRARELCEVSQSGRLALHLRGPRTTGRRLTDVVRELCGPASVSAVTLLVNDRVDIALAVGVAGGAAGGVAGGVAGGAAGGVAGVHLGARSLPPAEARRLLGAQPLLGVSVHSAGAAVGPAEAGVDYLFAGTLFETPSHPGAAVKGPELVGAVASRVELPVIGIGGVTPERVREVLASGGHGVAAIRGIWDSPSPPDAVQAYLDALELGDPDDESDLL